MEKKVMTQDQSSIHLSNELRVLEKIKEYQSAYEIIKNWTRVVKVTMKYVWWYESYF
jgi:hypothetical protein